MTCKPKAFGSRSRATRGSLNGCEDEELSLALRLAGWRFWYDPRLRLRQFLTADKLDWRHLRRRARNEGVSSVAL